MLISNMSCSSMYAYELSFYGIYSTLRVFLHLLFVQILNARLKLLHVSHSSVSETHSENADVKRLRKYFNKNGLYNVLLDYTIHEGIYLLSRSPLRVSFHEFVMTRNSNVMR
jgi:hypothetical protein